MSAPDLECLDEFLHAPQIEALTPCEYYGASALRYNVNRGLCPKNRAGFWYTT